MDPTSSARVVLEHRAEGALCKITLSTAALAELQQTGGLDLREGEEGVFLGSLGIRLVHGEEEIELTRCQVELTDD